MDRAFGALFAMIASIVINLLVDLVDIGLAITPVVLAFDAVLLVAALVLAILPGPGRALLYRRIGAVAGALASVLAATLFLTVFLTTIQAFLVADLGVHLAVRFLVVDIAAIAGWRWRRSLTTAARQFGGNIGHRMETARTGGTGHGWIRPATAATLGGLELAHLATHTHRSIRRHAYRAQLAAYRARRHIHRHGVQVGRTGAQSRSGNRLLAVLDATGPGRLLHRTAALGTTVGLTTLKYTAGAPVYLPRATRRARDKAAHRREQLRNRLAQARAFATEYTGNVASAYRAATKVTRPTRTAARAGTTATAPTATTMLRPTPPASQPRAGTGERDAPSHDEPGERLRQRLNRRRSARPD